MIGTLKQQNPTSRVFSRQDTSSAKQSFGHQHPVKISIKLSSIMHDQTGPLISKHRHSSPSSTTTCWGTSFSYMTSVKYYTIGFKVVFLLTRKWRCGWPPNKQFLKLESWSRLYFAWGVYSMISLGNSVFTRPLGVNSDPSSGESRWITDVSLHSLVLHSTISTPSTRVVDSNSIFENSYHYRFEGVLKSQSALHLQILAQPAEWCRTCPIPLS